MSQAENSRAIDRQIAESHSEIKRRWLAGEDAHDLARAYGLDLRKVRKIAMDRNAKEAEHEESPVIDHMGT